MNDNKSDHIHNKVTDYILEILPENEREAVQSHLQLCNECLLVAKEERLLTNEISRALRAAASPDINRLREINHSEKTRAGTFFMGSWQKPLAVSLLVLVIGIVVLGFPGNQSDRSWPLNPTSHYAITASTTSTPTNTATVSAVITVINRSENNIEDFHDITKPVSAPHPMLTPVATTKAIQ